MTICAQENMPIIAYAGPRLNGISIDSYKQMRECGFTESLNIYTSVEAAKADLLRAQKVGMKIWVNIDALYDNPQSTALQLKGFEAMKGYFIADEPNMTRLDIYKKKIDQIRTVDNTRPFYINLFPYLNDDLVKKIGAKSYRNYLQKASTLGLQQISFDYYPVTKNGVRATWYTTLEDIRRESNATGKPFWAFALSVPHAVYPAPTLTSLRLQIYSNLAYGAQAIQYFTYFTPQSKEYDFHNAPIGINGNKTPTWNIVKKMNKELRPIANLFYKSKIINVGHLLKIPKGASKCAMPTNIYGFSIEGTEGAVVSEFSKSGHKYLAIVNKDLKNGMIVYIKAKSPSVKHLTKSLAVENMKTKYKVAAGDILLFKLM